MILVLTGTCSENTKGRNLSLQTFKLVFVGQIATQAPMVSTGYKHEQHLRNVKYIEHTISADISNKIP